MKTTALEDAIFRANGDPQTPVKHVSHYRGEHCNFVPTRHTLMSNATEAVERYVAYGWLPKAPFITREHRITAFGSCFAHYIQHHLGRMGYRVTDNDYHAASHVIRYGAGINNTFALRQQFEWAFEDKPLATDLWFDEDGQLAAATEAERQATLSTFKETDVFILTLGLAEIWYDKNTGQACWRAVPVRHFDANRHAFRVSTVFENRENLHAVLDIIARHRPEAYVVLTLSPVRLYATFRPVSCITANSVSKAILRVAIDEVLRDRGHVGVLDSARLMYWPSYEIVSDLWPIMMQASAYSPDGQHPDEQAVMFVIQEFAQLCCLP